MRLCSCLMRGRGTGNTVERLAQANKRLTDGLKPNGLRRAKALLCHLTAEMLSSCCRTAQLHRVGRAEEWLRVRKPGKLIRAWFES
jgi:hypothetical protein